MHEPQPSAPLPRDPLPPARSMRRPLALWLYIAAGAVMIIWSGIKLLLSPFRR
jgi:hypothetical protein